MANRSSDMQGRSLEVFGAAVFWPLFAGALATFLWQVLHWLKAAAWQPLPAFLALDWLEVPRPQTGLPGVQLAIDWTLVNVPLAAGLLLLSVLGLWVKDCGTQQRRRNWRRDCNFWMP
ncbi:MAG: hypothetical protein JO357_08230 [Hyphomicrobiales bacterium]|nr:hypothetical protein [Hyphomicrobiales bacterium]MBV8768714.1 hypothetical protein [Hyphomicrobiales bacterium]MBV9052942.1 hypothetical protein [Hyphomicrobiales bacterium]MBV9137031.1 hypothetical protein [Hyphomicrobiales bacterium]MBV9588628.1 hypothetical protein [Hyphomicrobiales bacterium]